MKRDLDPSDPLTVILRRETFYRFRWAMLLWFVLCNTNSDEDRLRPPDPLTVILRRFRMAMLLWFALQILSVVSSLFCCS